MNDLNIPRLTEPEYPTVSSFITPDVPVDAVTFALMAALSIHASHRGQFGSAGDHFKDVPEENGRCFIDTANFALNYGSHRGPGAPHMPEELSAAVRVCHGTVWNPKLKCRMAHGWIEVTFATDKPGGSAAPLNEYDDPALCTTVSDRVHDEPIPRHIYYRAGQVDMDSVVRYTLEEVRDNILVAEHTGPWEHELLNMLEDGTIAGNVNPPASDEEDQD